MHVFSCCVHENKHEISVETYDEKHMNKGLATLVCSAYLDDCIKKWTSTPMVNDGNKP
ncbi:GNAT family N-acetyltransferase [Lysinibacillus sp. MHQ-1]|nr:GNAT family N-acetyltransferase [Lysinibacillus sp. MHQ-1]